MSQIKDKLFYYSASKDVAAGKGVKEFVTDPSKYVKRNENKIGDVSCQIFTNLSLFLMI